MYVCVAWIIWDIMPRVGKGLVSNFYSPPRNGWVSSRLLLLKWLVLKDFKYTDGSMIWLALSSIKYFCQRVFLCKVWLKSTFSC